MNTSVMMKMMKISMEKKRKKSDFKRYYRHIIFLLSIDYD